MTLARNGRNVERIAFDGAEDVEERLRTRARAGRASADDSLRLLSILTTLQIGGPRAIGEIEWSFARTCFASC